MLFSKKWLRNHQKFLLHFLIHIDVLMLCRKFELIPTKIFLVMAVSNIRKSNIYTTYVHVYVPDKIIKVVNSLLFIFGEI